LPEKANSYPEKMLGSAGGNSMSLIIYLIGFAFVIGGIAWALIVGN
jgi:hypothetical protein